jgi:stage II sporulation protein D
VRTSISVYRITGVSKASFFNMIRKAAFVLLHCLVLLAIITACAGPGVALKKGKGRVAEEKVFIRVAVRRETGTLNLSSDRLELLYNGTLEPLPSAVSLVVANGNVTAEGRSYRTPVRIRSNGTISVNGKEFYGDLLIEDGLLINSLPLEEYLKGVLSQEVSESWPMEALKAQAVVSRTYAVRRMVKKKDDPYDVEDTQMHQKFEYTNQNENINRAVEVTRGEILLYRGEPIEAFFHSCSGGITESAGSVFQQDLPYLRSIPDPYCRNIEQFSWTYEADAKSIKSALKGILEEEYTDPALDLRDVRIHRKTGSGRTAEFELYFEGGKPAVIQGNRFRLALDPKGLKSLLIRRIEKRRGEDGFIFIFSGTGYGHGVGMSQWGAKIMAEHGFRYENILAFYYRGTKLDTYKGAQ